MYRTCDYGSCDKRAHYIRSSDRPNDDETYVSYLCVDHTLNCDGLIRPIKGYPKPTVRVPW